MMNTELYLTWLNDSSSAARSLRGCAELNSEISTWDHTITLTDSRE